ncbi:MAG: thioredoxin domain-containing protein [Dehalococcoidales bacterium]|nr:MAG: thioredoxin domain-containing protein [Dehalococcoidales bacterium]
MSSNEGSGSTSTELPDGSTKILSESTTEPNPTIVVSGKSIGSPLAPITIVEYSDFQCHYCQKFALEIEPLIDKYYIQTGKVRFVYKHLIGFGDESRLAAEASESAAEQNQFWPYYHALMRLELSSSTEDFTAEKAQDLAQQLGLNMSLFNESLATGKYRDKVSQEDAESRSLGFELIPAFFVNGVQADEIVEGSFEEFSKVLDAELKRLGE